MMLVIIEMIFEGDHMATNNIRIFFNLFKLSYPHSFDNLRFSFPHEEIVRNKMFFSDEQHKTKVTLKTNSQGCRVYR